MRFTRKISTDVMQAEAYNFTNVEAFQPNYSVTLIASVFS